MTKTTTQEPPNVTLKLPHCGELSVAKGRIEGWVHPIPLKLWAMIIGFHRRVSMLHNAESVSYHRWNPKYQRYDTIVPYQSSSKRGLAVHTDWQSRKNQALLDKYAAVHGVEFFPANTIHTHVDVAAFESGIDAGDEKDLPGWHITIGRLLSYVDYDIHTRLRLPRLPKLKDLISTDEAHEFPMKHLFERGVTAKKITRMPSDNEHFTRYIDRVSLY